MTHTTVAVLMATATGAFLLLWFYVWVGWTLLKKAASRQFPGIAGQSRKRLREEVRQRKDHGQEIEDALHGVVEVRFRVDPRTHRLHVLGVAAVAQRQGGGDGVLVVEQENLELDP